MTKGRGKKGKRKTAIARKLSTVRGNDARTLFFSPSTLYSRERREER